MKTRPLLLSVLIVFCLLLALVPASAAQGGKRWWEKPPEQLPVPPPAERDPRPEGQPLPVRPPAGAAPPGMRRDPPEPELPGRAVGANRPQGDLGVAASAGWWGRPASNPPIGAPPPAMDDPHEDPGPIPLPGEPLMHAASGEEPPPPDIDDPIARIILALMPSAEAPPFPVDEHGNLDLSHWTYLGETREWIGGLHMELPGGVDVGLGTLYHWYRDDAGYFYAVPTNFTALYGLLTGNVPYLENVVGAQMNGLWATLNMITGVLEGYDVGRASTLQGVMDAIYAILEEGSGYSMAEYAPQLSLLAALLSDLRHDARFWLELNRTLWQDGETIPLINPSNLSQLVIVYQPDLIKEPEFQQLFPLVVTDAPSGSGGDDDGGDDGGGNGNGDDDGNGNGGNGNGDDDGNGDNGDGDNGNGNGNGDSNGNGNGDDDGNGPLVPPTPVVPIVPPNPLAPSPGPPGGLPYMEIDFGVEVRNAVVVGQDPEERGADIYLIIVVPPVIYEYEVEDQAADCIYSDTPSADWDGCDYDMDGDGLPDHPGDPHWTEASRSNWVVQHQIVPDRVDLQAGLYRFEAHLTPESQAWILGELRTQYPNAVVVEPAWNLPETPRFRLTANRLDGDERHLVNMETTYVPFIDPGFYDVLARFVTVGTRFVPPSGNYRNVKAKVDGQVRAATRTPPRLLERHELLKIWLHDARLVE